MPNNEGFGIKITAAQIVDLAKVSKQIQSELNTIKNLKVDINSVNTSGIKTSIQTAIKEAFQSAKVGKINVNASANVDKTNTSGLNNTASQIERINKAIASMTYDAKIARLSEGFKKTSLSAKEVSEKIETVQKAYNKLKDPNNKGDLVKNFNELNNILNKTQNELNIAQIEAKQYIDTFKKAKLKNDIETWLKSNTAATKEAKDAMKMYLDEINRGDITPFREKEIRSGMGTITNEMRQMGRLGGSLTETFKSGAKSFMEWTASSGAVMRTIQTIREMVQAVYDVDTAMTELEKVSNATTSQLINSLEESTKTAKKFGATISDVVSATADWSRLGYSLPDSEELAKIATIYKNVGDGIDIDTANKSLVSTLQGFQLDTNEALHIIDSFNEVANNYAIDSAGIGEALQRSASSMYAAGNTLEETIGLVTAANAVVQDPDSIGVAYKTISMRIRGAKTEMESLGLETEGMVESTATLQKEILALSGVDIMQDKDTFKSTYDILDELSSKWSELTDIQRATITELIAGKRQGNVVSALMTNFETARKATETAMNSQGSAMKEQETYMSSLQAKTEQFKASFQSLSQTVMDSNFLKGLVDTGTEAINVLDWIIDKVGILGTVATVGGGILGGKNIGRPKMFGLVLKYADNYKCSLGY